MEAFDAEEVEEHRLWVIDPGIANTFVAADGCGSERHEYRAFSQSEFYTLAGYKRSQRKIQQWKADENIETLESNLPTAKTSSWNEYVTHINACHNAMPRRLHFYNERFSRLRFLNYIGRQKATAEMVRVAMTGTRKYGKKRKKKRRRISMRLPTAVVAKRKWRPRPVQQDARKPLFGSGDGQLSPSLRGRPAGLSKAFHKGLKIAGRRGHLIVVQVNEFRISKVCSRCKTIHFDDLASVSGVEGTQLRAVLRCQHCRTVWQPEIFFTSPIHCREPKEGQSCTKDNNNNNSHNHYRTKVMM